MIRSSPRSRCLRGRSAYFEAIVAGRNPLRRPYGAAVRMFNLKHFEDAIISVKSEDGIFLYDVRRKDGQLVSSGADWNLLVARGGQHAREGGRTGPRDHEERVVHGWLLSAAIRFREPRIPDLDPEPV